MSFKAFMQFLETDNPVTDIQHAANRVVKDEDFPITSYYETLINYVKTNAEWRHPGHLNQFKEAFAVYADGFNVSLDWQHSLDFIEANKPEHFNTLTAEEKEVLLNWINSDLEPFRTKGYYSLRNSYRLKHSFQFSEVGFYITGGQFKGAMLVSGFEPRDYDALNWEFTLGKYAGITII